jgi:hypothetical protein
LSFFFACFYRSQKGVLNFWQFAYMIYVIKT